MTFNPKRALFGIFLFWLFISAFYYAPNLIEGQLLIERADDFWHKIIKYIIVLLICSGYFLTHGNVRYFLQIIFLSLAAFLMTTSHPTGFQSNFGFDAITVFLVLIGLIHYSARLTDAQLKELLKVVIVSSVLVSVISYFEYFIFEPVLGDFWRNTGGFRSVSTMLNPNNLGIYLGCSLIFLVFSNSFIGKTRLLFFITIAGAILLSGSRTAWLSFVATLSIGMVYRGHGKFSTTAATRGALYILLILSTISFIMAVDAIKLPERMVDFETAIIRLDKYFEYIYHLDETYIWPDIRMLRIDAVSESAYFHFLNAVGFLCAFPFFLYMLTRVNLPLICNFFSNRTGRCFDVAAVYYAIAMLFENVFMSFPNNQLMFVVIGACIGSHHMRKTPRSNIVNQQIQI